MASHASTRRLRIGEPERDRCVERLQTSFVVGLLEQDELEDRVGQALVARSQGELDDLLADCRPQRARSSPSVWQRAAVCLAAVAAIGTLAGTTGGGVASTVESPRCIATGVATPDDVDCPTLTREQVRLMHDADSAAAAAQQVQDLASAAAEQVGDPASTADGAQLEALVTRAQAASDRAQAAVVDAQLIRAEAPDGRVGQHELDAVAKKARLAAAEARRAVVRANAVISH